jgi:hypothetical protein
VVIDPEHHVAVHLHEPSVRVEREASITARRREPFHRLGVQPEVQDRVHHPGHRHARARTHRDEQGIRGIAETPPRAKLHALERELQLRREALREVGG